MNIKDYLLNPKTCNQCKKPLPYNKRKNKYCDAKCGDDHYKQIARIAFNNAQLIGPKAIRRHMLQIYGNKCSCCKLCLGLL